MRVSIRPYLHDWVNEVGQQMGCADDPTETVNHLLRECKRLMGQPAATVTTENSNLPNKDLVDVLSNEFGVWQ